MPVGFGSSTDYSDCQPLISRTHSLGSLASRNTSFTSPASQTEFITYAQEMLLHRQDASTPSASTGHAPPCSSQQLQPEQRQAATELLSNLILKIDFIERTLGHSAAAGL